MISVRNLHKRFGSVTAVSDMSFDIGSGEVVAFLGPNGAGKTTALRIISGFFTPDSGEVEVDGIPVLENTVEVQRRIGYLPENNPLYKDMPVADFLTVSANLKGIPRSERADAFDYVVDAVGIDDVFYRPIGQLSKGYKQRVGIAMALLHRPRLLILDEPTEGLDPIQRAEIRSLITNLAAEHTVIMSTHVMQEAQAVSSRVIIVNRGTVVADGSAEDLARAATGDRVLTVEIAGTHVKKALGSMPGVASVATEAVPGKRTRAVVTLQEDAEIRPALAQIARERNWEIWHLSEAEHKLEDVFYQLTSES